MKFELCMLIPTVPKARPRATIAGHIFMPERYRAWTEEARRLLRLDWTQEPLEGPLELHITFWGPSRQRGDLEGLLGSWADAMSGYKDRPGIVFHDDAQIETLSGRFAPAEEWCATIEVRHAEPIEWPKKQRKRRAKA